MDVKYLLKRFVMSFVLFAYCRRFPDVLIDTVSGILEDFDFSLKSDQKRFGFNLGLLQRELK